MDIATQIDDRLAGAATEDGLLVAWSGGLDSTMLLHAALAWARPRGVDVAAVHVDHRLRPSSRADAAFCRRLGHRLGVSVCVEALDVGSAGSLQESARVQRYAAIARVAARLGLGVVATAHHADDALETALLNFRRGSSAGGLSSIVQRGNPPIPAWPDLDLVRPLVGVSKRQIRAYAEERGLTWRTDPTNATLSNARNRLRHHVLPALTDDGRLVAPMLATLENLASESRALDAMVGDVLDRALLDPPDAESAALRGAVLREAPEAVVVGALQAVADRLPAEVGLGRDHLRDVTGAIASQTRLQVAARGANISVDRGLVFVEVARGRGGKYLARRVAEPIELDVSAPTEGGAIPWFGSQIGVGASTNPGDSNTAKATFVANQIPDTVVVRGPRPGDRLDAEGMAGHKSVADLLAEAGVPACYRWRWPCVVLESDTRHVEWVCGIRRSKRAAQSPSRDSTTQLGLRVATSSVIAAILHDATNFQYS